MGDVNSVSAPETLDILLDDDARRGAARLLELFDRYDSCEVLMNSRWLLAATGGDCCVSMGVISAERVGGPPRLPSRRVLTCHDSGVACISVLERLRQAGGFARFKRQGLHPNIELCLHPGCLGNGTFPRGVLAMI